MFKDPRKVFFLIAIFSAILVIINLPENYPLKFQVGSIKVDRFIHSPVINIETRFFRFYKDFRTHLGLDLAGGSHLVLQADMTGVAENERVDALGSVREVIERRVNFFGLGEPVVQSSRTKDAYRIIVELPGVTDSEKAIQIIGQTAKLEFRSLVGPQSTESALLFPTLKNTLPAGVTGKDLASAALTYSTETGEPQVAIKFTKEGTEKFAVVTKQLVGKPLAIFLDDFPLTWPTVSTVISDGNAVITGSFTVDGARTLALQLKAGALPVPVTVVEKRTVDATLGKQSVEKSVLAGGIGLAVVAIFMTLQYGWLGVTADLALIVYGLIAFAMFRTVPITLTLPGIAGFILSIGMAVDSNILIFERFKEEVRLGKPRGIAMELGFGKAWDSIRDANITTILTAIILYNPFNWQFLPSSGMVRGFAATLLIGVLISLFTGIVVSRTFIRVLYRKALMEKSEKGTK